MPSVHNKPKSVSAIGYHNGYPVASTMTSSSTAPTKMTAYNGRGYSNQSNASITGHVLSQAQTSLQEKATISMDGSMKNLPRSMLNDQYGLAALFVGIKAAKYMEPGPDALFTEVVNEMSAPKPVSPNEPLYKRFSGPLTLPAEPESFSVENAGHGVPIYPEYLVTQRMIAEAREPDIDYIRKTWALKMDKFGDELLFYVFYTFTRDILQMLAAKNLYQKGWRFHIEAKVWMQRLENGVYAQDNGNPSHEKGIYKYFDFKSWKIEQVETILDTNKLEGPPQVPTDCFASASPKT